MIAEPLSLPPLDFALPSTQGEIWFAAELALLRFNTSPAEDPVGLAWSGISFQWFLWLLRHSGLKCCKHRPPVLPPKDKRSIGRSGREECQKRVIATKESGKPESNVFIKNCIMS